jgi:putative ABC transport system permease protein
MSDLRYAVRSLLKTPGFTLATGVTLAMGVGASTAIFSIVNAVLIQSLPYRDAGQLVQVTASFRALNMASVGLSVPELDDLREDAGVFDRISPASPENENLTDVDRPERLELMVGSVDYFSLLGAEAQLGRVFRTEDAVPGFSEGVVISDSLWRRRFGGDPAVIGRKLRLDDDLFTVIGVMPPGFRHPGRTLQADVDLWSAAGWKGAPFPPPVRSLRTIREAIARLRPGLNVVQAQARLNAFGDDLARRYPEDYPEAARWAPRLIPLRQALVGTVRPMLVALLTAIGLVLMIACVNIATLLLARASTRRREVAVRLALGAGPWRLIRQMLTESLVFSVLAGAAGLGATPAFLRAMLLLAPSRIPRLNEIRIDGVVLGFAMAVSLLTSVLCGLAPAVQASKPDLLENLRAGNPGSGSIAHQNRLRRLLVITEFALSLALMIGAGLLLRTFGRLLEVNPGFDPRHVLVAQTWLPAPNDQTRAPYFELPKRSTFVKNLVRRVNALPGVERAAITTSVPLDVSRSSAQFAIESHSDLGQGSPESSDPTVRPTGEFAAVTPDYFRVMGTRLVRGRFLNDGDNEQAVPAVVVDENMARRFWPGQDPVGRRIQPEPRGRLLRNSGWLTIVGVVGDIKTGALDAPSSPHVYLSIFQHSDYSIGLVVRAGPDPAVLGEALRREIRAEDPNLPVFGVRTMESLVAEALAERRFSALLAGVFAAAALFLAGGGVYGTIAYSVKQRTREIGIRLALGAGRRDVVKWILGEGMVLALAGAAAGLVGTVGLAGLLSGLLYDVRPTDPLTYAAAFVTLVGVALLACYVPADRATRVDPVSALRAE